MFSGDQLLSGFLGFGFAQHLLDAFLARQRAQSVEGGVGRAGLLHGTGRLGVVDVRRERGGRCHVCLPVGGRTQQCIYLRRGGGGDKAGAAGGVECVAGGGLLICMNDSR